MKELLWNDLLIGQGLSGRQRVVGVRDYMEPFTGIKQATHMTNVQDWFIKGTTILINHWTILTMISKITFFLHF